MEWVQDNQGIGPAMVNLKVGHKGVKVACVFYSGMVSKSDPNKYHCEILLPGIKLKESKYLTEQEAKDAAENAVNVWFKSWTQPSPPNGE